MDPEEVSWMWMRGSPSKAGGWVSARGWESVRESGYDIRGYWNYHGNIGIRGLGVKETGEAGRFITRGCVDVRQQKSSPGQTT
jgi:hypothetical protein